MGQRGNYIVKSEDSVNIHYTHWRANTIVHDLLIGPRKFLKFINEFELKDQIISEPWIEGCVLIDTKKQLLIFWEHEHLHELTVRNKYLNHLSEIWEGWEIRYAIHEMFDIESELNVSYTSKQETNFDKEINLDKLLIEDQNEHVWCHVIIKENEKFSLKKVYSGSDEELVLAGNQIVDILKTKTSFPLPKESDLNAWDLILIDCDNKRLFINQSITGLKEELQRLNLWSGWEITLGNFGYLGLLQIFVYDVESLKISEPEARKRISEMENHQDNFDPIKLAEKLQKQSNDIEFHPNYFENIKRPKKSFFEKLKGLFK